MKHLFTLGFVLAALALSAQAPIVNLSSSGFIDCAQPGTGQATLYAFHTGSFGHWTGPFNFISSQQVITVTKAGEYTFCAYSSQGGMTCASINVQQKNTLPVNAVFCGHCSNQFRIGLDGLPANYTGYWTNGLSTSYSIQCTDIYQPGNWIAHAIDPETGCESNDAILVTSVENKFPDVHAGTDIGLGCGYLVGLNGSAGQEPGMIDYIWTTTDGHFVGDPKTPDPLIDKVGTYVLSIWNVGVGCIKRDTCLVKPGYYKWVDTLTTNVLCQGDSTGSIDLTPSGPRTPYTYLWENGDTTEDRHGLKAGRYKVLVTEVTGCAAYRSVYITEPDTLDFQIAMEQTSTIPIVGFKVTLSASGGANPAVYQYRRQRMNGTWANWSNSPVFMNVPKLTLGFAVRIKPGMGCNLERTKFIAVQVVGEPVDRAAAPVSNLHENLQIYPNPAHNTAEIIFPNTGEEEETTNESLTISLYDGLGRLAKTFQSEDHTATLTWGDELVPGIYSLVARNARGAVTGTARLEVSIR